MVSILIPMNELTDRQKAIYDFVTLRIKQNQIPPTWSEIAHAFGFASTRAVQKHLQAIEAKGYLSLHRGQARGISLPTYTRLQARSVSLRLPILGRVAAGSPIGADANFDFTDDDDVLSLDRAMFSPTPDYLLKIKGDSMQDDGIFDADLVAIKRSNTANQNQIVVARLDGEITIKRFQQIKHEIFLLPRNPNFTPIKIKPEVEFAIEGVYCGLIRRGST